MSVEGFSPLPPDYGQSPNDSPESQETEKRVGPAFTFSAKAADDAFKALKKDFEDGKTTSYMNDLGSSQSRPTSFTKKEQLEISTNLSRRATILLESSQFQQMGHNPDAAENKTIWDKAQSVLSEFLSSAIAFFKSMIPPKVMVYFSKDKEASVNTPQQSNAVAEKVSDETTQELSQAARALKEKIMTKPEDVFNSVGVFRTEEYDKNKRDALIVQLKQSPSQAEITETDSNVLAGAFKKIYADLNLFGDHFVALETAAKALQTTPPTDSDTIVKYLMDLKNKLPAERQVDLKNYIEVFAKASEFGDKTKMSAHALADMAGPNLCQIPLDKMMNTAKPINEVAHQLILNFKQVFPES